MKKAKADWVDNLIGVFSPKAKAKRLQFKYASNMIQRKYEGAAIGRRTDGWRTSSTDATSEISQAISKLRDRCRDLVRNNPWASRGIQVIANSVVGHGIMTQLKIDEKRGNNKRETKANELWQAWAQTTACDYDQRNTIFGMQNLIMRGVAESGGVLVRRRIVRGGVMVKAPSGEIVEVPPIRLQILETDFLSNLRDSEVLENGNVIKHGIELDGSTGQRVAYHLFKQHPGESFRTSVNSADTVRIPADEILHIYRTDRPGQLLGAPFLAPVIMRLFDLDEFEQAEIVRSKIASMFTAFVHDLSGIEAGLDEDEQEILLGEKMEPGQIEILPPGKDIKIATPPSKEGYESFTRSFLHSIATGLGITYESLVGDLSQANFSSARLGKIEMHKNIDTWQQQIMIDQFMRPVVEWFLFGAELNGMKAKGIRATFTPPKREMIDPTKETAALKDAVRSGFITLSEALRQQGKDPDAHFLEYKSDMDLITELDLTLDSDARSGQTEDDSFGK